MSATSFAEYAARSFEPHTRRWASPGDMARYLDPKTLQTPALQIVDEHLVDLIDTPDGRLALSMPPQEGKSQRASRRFPLWALVDNPDLRIGIVSYEHGVARRWGRAIRDDIAMHSKELGISVRADLSAQHEWQLDGHEGGVYAVGIGGALTGRPIDLLIIDDPIKDRSQADSPMYRERAWNWWLEVGSTRLSPGASVIVIATRWHHEDLIGKLLGAEDQGLWDVVNIPAQDDAGAFMQSTRQRTTEQWEAIKVRSGARTWASLYQGKPTPDSGNVLPADWWQFYTQPLWIEGEDGVRLVPNAYGADVELCQSWDFTFKDTKHSDFVVGQVWLRRGANAYLLDQVRGRMTFTDSLLAMKTLTGRWPQATAKLVEDKANGPAILNSLRAQLAGLIPVEPEGSKYARASAISPLAQAGNVWLPDPMIAPWVSDLIQECREFPNGSHDDQVDGLTQALHRLLLVPMLDGTLVESEDILEELDEYQGISPY